MNYQQTDNFGNKITLESGKPMPIRLFLKGKRPKLIAHYDWDSRTLIVKRNSARHFHYTSKSYGFNFAILDSLEINEVHLTIDKERFNIPFKAFESARVLNFSQQGFEVQKFLPVEIIRKYEMQLV
jgi:hypothetical protein